MNKKELFLKKQINIYKTNCHLFPLNIFFCMYFNIRVGCFTKTYTVDNYDSRIISLRRDAIFIINIVFLKFDFYNLSKFSSLN